MHAVAGRELARHREQPLPVVGHAPQRPAVLVVLYELLETYSASRGGRGSQSRRGAIVGRDRPSVEFEEVQPQPPLPGRGAGEATGEALGRGVAENRRPRLALPLGCLELQPDRFAAQRWKRAISALGEARPDPPPLAADR